MANSAGGDNNHSVINRYQEAGKRGIKGSSTRYSEKSKTTNRSALLHIDCSLECGTLCAMPTTVAMETVP